MTIPKTWQGPEPDDITMWTVVRAGHMAGQQFYKYLAEIDLTPTQFGVLLVLDETPGISNGALARAVHVAAQSMSELLLQLEVSGLIKRPLGLTRGKKSAISLTTAGRRKLRDCQAIIERIETSTRLSSRELTQLNLLLHKLLFSYTGSDNNQR